MLPVPNSTGVYNRTRASRVPAICQEHHSYEGALQREAGKDLPQVQQRHRGAVFWTHTPRQCHGPPG